MDHEAVGSVSKPSAPKIYDVWRRKEEERKVNKNLGEITVPGGGKPRLISCTRLSPSCLHLRSHSLTRSNLFSLVPRCIIFHPPPEERERESSLLLRAVTTTYRPRKRRLKTDVFHFPPDLIPLLSTPRHLYPIPPSLHLSSASRL